MVQAAVVLVRVIWQGSAGNAGSATGAHSADVHALLQSPEVDHPQDERQERDNALQEQVEEQDSSRAAQKAVDNYYGFTCRGLRRCVAVPFE